MLCFAQFPSLVAVAGILFLFVYVFSMLFTGLYGDLLYDVGYLDWDYFGRLNLSFITLYQLMTTTLWLGVVRQVMVPRPRAWIGLFAFVIITNCRRNSPVSCNPCETNRCTVVRRLLTTLSTHRYGKCADKLDWVSVRCEKHTPCLR